MCCLHSDIAVLSLLFTSLSYQGASIVYYYNQPQSLIINISTTELEIISMISTKVVVLCFYNSTLYFIIINPWLFKKNYEMDTVITMYVDLRENFVQWECTCRARQHFTLPWKQNMHFTALCCRFPHSTASCRAWSGFFTTVWPSLQLLQELSCTTVCTFS